MFHFRRGKSFGEGVGEHVVGWAVDESYGTFFNNITYEMEPYVDVLGTGMVLVILREFNGGLIIGEEGGGVKCDVE